MTKAHDDHELTLLERGHKLSMESIDCYIADRQTPIRHGTADVGDEIAEELRNRLRDVNDYDTDLRRTVRRLVHDYRQEKHPEFPDVTYGFVMRELERLVD